MQFLDYTITERLGGGATGTVYRARDRRQGRTVALKLTHAQADARVLAQLGREARRLHLEHPNILVPERLEKLEDGRLLLVTPFVEGRTLEKWLVPVAFDRALEVALQVAAGLAYAHAKGVLHCDIKPANLLHSGEQIKILDFGLSHLLGDPAESIRGTPEYMSPEAARGQGLTAQSDLWSLGVVLYELLTGHSPFAATSLTETLRRIARAEVRPLTQWRPELPPEVDLVLARLLSKTSEARYPDAEALQVDLRALTTGAPLAPVNVASQVIPPISIPQTLRVLPPKPDLLLGREDEFALLALYLNDPECRLLTLQGLGGVGKTHLSVWLSHELRQFSHVHFVELAEATAEGFVPALSGVLGLDEPSLDALKRTVAARRQLLVLDNFEHLTAQAPLLALLLEACPELVIFATSRARLGLASEWVMPLQGLGVPAELPEPRRASRYGALALFEHRAKQAAPDFELLPALPSVWRICSRLQGHPLGIMLAAGLLRDTPVGVLAEQLEESFVSLEGGTGRHHSLKAVFMQSCALLSPAQQALLSTLTLFEGGAEANAAEVVTGAAAEELGELLERSLLERTLEGRYVQHPLIGQFSRALLVTPSADAVQRYRKYYLSELRRLDAALRSPRRRGALAAVARDEANLRAALRSEAISPELGEPLRVFYTQQGRYLEGLELFSADPSTFAQACAGWFALLLGDLERAEANVEGAARADEQRVQLIALNTKAGVLARRNDLEASKATTLEVLALARALGDATMVSASLTNLAMLEESWGRPAEAVAHYEESLELSSKSEDYAQMLVSLNNLASLYLDGGEAEKARDLLGKGLLLSDKHRLTRMKPLLQINFGFSLYLSGDPANAEIPYLEAHRALLERGDVSGTVITEAYLGQTYGAQGDAEKAYSWLHSALTRAQATDDQQGMLCALVRIAELCQHQQDIAQGLASLVYTHAFSEPSERQLAARLGGREPARLSLSTTVAALLSATTLAAAEVALRRSGA